MTYQPRYCTLVTGVVIMVMMSIAHTQTDGYRGIYYDLGRDASFSVDGREYTIAKYAGGLGTYPQQTAPIAVYDAEARKTFFVYGGTGKGKNELENRIGCYDHETGKLARPVSVRNVGGTDIHKNATIQLAPDGHLWIFAHSHGGNGSGNIYRSRVPHSASGFTDVTGGSLPGEIFPGGDLAYGNPIIDEKGRVLEIYNIYPDNRGVHVATGQLRDDGSGIDWNQSGIDQTRLLKFGTGGHGHYALARRKGPTVGLVANWHDGHLDNRTNLYYLESKDFGASWAPAGGKAIAGALTSVDNAALVKDYHASEELVYLKDLAYSKTGQPVILYLTVADVEGAGHAPGPHATQDYPNGLRRLRTARYDGSQWVTREVLATDHNYDHGEMWIEEDGTWRIVGAFLEGPQKWAAGGDIGLWSSSDQGQTWVLDKRLTAAKDYNHTYPRLVQDGDKAFFALWADGDATGQEQTASSLYFMTRDGQVYRMPTDFGQDDWLAPEQVARRAVAD